MKNQLLRAFILQELSRRPCRIHDVEAVADTILQECDRDKILDPLLIVAVMHVESAYNPSAQSPVGALGIMQVMPSTGKEVATQECLPYERPEDLLDPLLNIRLGCRYLARMYYYAKNDWPAALTAYNRGPGNLRKIMATHKMIPASVLASYSDLVFKKCRALKNAFDASGVNA